ncbi:MAG: quinone oxidoreductase [Kineosporiaceae bacterium]
MGQTQGISIDAFGGADVMRFGPVEVAEPGEGDLLVAPEAAGVNFIDTYQRSGLYPITLPAVLGMEGAGTVLEIGPGVTDFAVGDLVAWLDVPGSYAARVVVPAARAVPVPDGVTAPVAAASMLQGVTAQYLTTDSHPVRAGQTVLVHAAAGGVGLLLVQLAAAAGARVLGTVGTPEKAELARAAGAHEVILYRDQDVVASVEQLVGPHAVDVVYDGVGQATFAASLDVLRPRGMLVSFGNASGPVEPVAPLVLATKGSLFLTRPMLAHHVTETDELRRRAGAVLGMVESRRLDVRIGGTFPLDQARAAHQALEQRRTTGKVILTP